MTQPLPDSPLEGLHQRLQSSRVRLQTQRLLVGLSWGLLLAAMLWLGMALFRWLGLLPSGFPGGLPLLGGALWTLGWGLYLVRTPPSLALMAQKAEQRFGLDERLSTALEVAHKNPRDPVHAQVYRALLEDAAARTPAIRPGELVRLRLPRALIYALGIATLAFGLGFLPAVSRQKSVTAQAPGLSPEEQAATVTQLERVAQVVRQDAERRNDPYLQATVRSLERLRADLQTGRLSATLAQQEVAQLGERIEQSYRLPQPPEATPASGNPTASGNPPPANPPENSGPPASQPGSADQNPTANPPPNPSQTLDNLATRLERQRQNTAEPKAPQARPPQQQTQCDPTVNCGDQYAIARAQQAKDAEATARNQINRPPGGAPGGSGDQAGEGEGGKTGARGNALPPKSDTQTVRLPFQTPQSGRRIQIMAPPSASPAPASGLGGDVQSQNWARQEEVPIGLGYLEGKNRAVVSNYFTPPKENP